MVNKLLKRIVNFFVREDYRASNKEQVFRQKVNNIIDGVADYGLLYEYNVISQLNEKEKIKFVGDTTKHFLLVKNEILQERRN